MRRFLITLLIILLAFPCYSQYDSESHVKATKLANEGMELSKQGKYAESLPMLESSWSYYFTNLPFFLSNQVHPDDVRQFLIDYATVSDALAQNYFFRGNLRKAEELYSSTIDLLKNVLQDEWIYRQLLNDIGWLYYNLHNWDKSDYYFAEAKYLCEKNLDLGDFYASLLSNYSILQLDMGNTLRAKMYVDTAKSIWLNEDKNDTEGLSTILENVANTYSKLGFDEDALSTMLYAIELKSKSTNTNGMSVLLNNLGVLFSNQKKYSEAQSYFQKAFDMSQDSQSKFSSGMNLAWAQFLLRDKECMVTSQIVSDTIISDVMNKFTYLSNEERELYWIFNNVRLSIINAISANYENGQSTGIIYNNSLFAKGLLLKTSNQIKRDILTSGDHTSIEMLEKMNELDQNLASGNNSADQIVLLKDSIAYYDKELTKRSTTYETFKEELSPDWKRIKKALAKNEAAIEFVQIPIIEGDSLPEPFVYKYYGLIVRSNSDNPILVPLCTEEELDEIISKRTQAKLDRYINNLYSTGNERLTSGEKLYNAIWAPLEGYLSGVKTIYYSLSGQLNTISFSALTQDSVALCDRYSLYLLSSTAEVPHIKNEHRSDIADAVIYGGIRYDLSSEEMIVEAQGYEKAHAVSNSIESDSIRSGWKYLPGTEVEAESIKSTFYNIGIPIEVYMGAKANEESFKSLSGHSPYLMHIATHGFFLSDPKEVVYNPFIQSQEINSVPNLLLRSGLLFAGANRAWLNGENVKGIEDGILTAEEISKLDLSSTGVVALSACETGLGEVVSTEGVFGLQRAFKLAGVNTLIMSLWKVPDEATSKLMVSFYENWATGEDIHDAFRKAQSLIKEEYKSPYYWAGFVMLD